MAWHATAVPDDEPLVVSATLVVPARELRWRATASGGPGGQHANTSNTKVELVFDVEASEALTDTQRERLLARLGSQVRVVASDERSQARNRALARERMAERLAAALRTHRRRTATRPTKGSVERRLSEKRQQSERKQRRQDRPDER